jgi:hypothetical protein
VGGVDRDRRPVCARVRNLAALDFMLGLPGTRAADLTHPDGERGYSFAGRGVGEED